LANTQESVVTNRIRGPEGGPIEANAGPRQIERVTRTAGVRHDQGASPASTDSVEITASAHTLLSLQQAIAELPDMDAARVARLRLAIENQTYTIDAGRIADRLLQLEGELFAASATR
jgi:negative regulator of flagellin synthesis FlgM